MRIGLKDKLAIIFDKVIQTLLECLVVFLRVTWFV